MDGSREGRLAGDEPPNDDDGEGPPMPTLAELEAGLIRSREDIAAGRTEPLEEVLGRLSDKAAIAARIREERVSRDEARAWARASADVVARFGAPGDEHSPE